MTEYKRLGDYIREVNVRSEANNRTENKIVTEQKRVQGSRKQE